MNASPRCHKAQRRNIWCSCIHNTSVPPPKTAPRGSQNLTKRPTACLKLPAPNFPSISVLMATCPWQSLLPATRDPCVPLFPIGIRSRIRLKSHPAATEKQAFDVHDQGHRTTGPLQKCGTWGVGRVRCDTPLKGQAGFTAAFGPTVCGQLWRRTRVAVKVPKFVGQVNSVNTHWSCWHMYNAASLVTRCCKCSGLTPSKTQGTKAKNASSSTKRLNCDRSGSEVTAGPHPAPQISPTDAAWCSSIVILPLKPYLWSKSSVKFKLIC